MHLHTKQVNMLEGPLTGKIVRFAIPLACASVLQQLFNSADLAVIGRFENATAMAAVGSNAAIVSLLVSLFSGLSLGSNVTVASLIGMKKHEEVNRAVHTCVALSMICGVIICILGEVIAPQILKVTSVPANVLPLATLYLRILFFALPFLIIYDFGSSVLRAKGDSTRPLYVLFVSGIMNVILNIIFVALFHLSVAGVAIATMISNMFSAFTILFFLRHEEPEFMISMKKLRIEKQYLKRIIGIGAPAGIQGMVFSLSNVIIQAGINSFGANYIAANTAALNFETMGYYVINAFGQAATTFTSQNFSAKLYDRCKRIYRIAIVIGMSSTFVLSMIFWFGRAPFMSFFTTSETVMKIGYIRLMIIDNFELLTGTYEIPGGCLRGMGHSLIPAIITMIGSCVFRVIWVSTIFVSHHTLSMLLIVYPISWVICGTAMHIAYFTIRHKLFKQA